MADTTHKDMGKQFTARGQRHKYKHIKLIYNALTLVL